MKVFMFRKKNQPDELGFNRFADELNGLKMNITKVDPNSPEGVDLVSLYDVVDFPAALIIQDDGTLIERWQGRLPTKEEISHFYHQ